MGVGNIAVGKTAERGVYKMNNHRIFRGQPEKYDKCLLVPSALRGYWPRHYPFSAIECCNDCLNIVKVEKLLKELKIDIDKQKKEYEKILKKGPFENCDGGIPYLFWLSIVFCEKKFANMGKNTSFSGVGLILYPINRWNNIEDNNGGIVLNLDGATTIEEYAKKIVQYYFEHNPPCKLDDFIRIYMAHQHYCKDSYDYECWKKYYKLDDGSIVDGNDVPDHFTLLLDWTESECIAKEFAGEGGTIVSIDPDKYDNFIGSDYRMSYDDKILTHHLIDTADKQKGVVTFWPWTFTIDELEHNEFGRALDFKVDVRHGKG
jgi:hypothetical protein